MIQPKTADFPFDKFNSKGGYPQMFRSYNIKMSLKVVIISRIQKQLSRGALRKKVF